jgi:hypothetical protein
MLVLLDQASEDPPRGAALPERRTSDIRHQMRAIHRPAADML